jgi:hypothetical protein
MWARLPEERDRFIYELGLDLLTVMNTNQGVKLERYNWPKHCNGTVADRTVSLLVWPNGEWCESLDTGMLATDETIVAMRAMASVYHDKGPGERRDSATSPAPGTEPRHGRSSAGLPSE